MSREILFRVLVSVVTILCLGAAAHNRNIRAQDNPAAGRYASVNGLELYYETYGAGEPLVLLHGGLGGIVEFSQLIPLLAENRQVIAVELQGHGHTADIDRPLSFGALADDVAALIQTLGYERADLMGFSMGGGVALQTAIQHPEVVRKLVLVSTPYQRAGIHPEFRAGMDVMSAEGASAMLETPMYQFYASVAPNLENWPSLVGKVGEMMRQEYDWSEDVAAITAPTLVIVGDSDFIPPSHGLELFERLGGGVPGDFVGMIPSQMAVLPGTSHFTILTRTDLLLPVVTPFLDAPA
jgi:pimeloyl-ACP methyl ester carboxylesterase